MTWQAIVIIEWMALIAALFVGIKCWADYIRYRDRYTCPYCGRTGIARGGVGWCFKCKQWWPFT